MMDLSSEDIWNGKFEEANKLWELMVENIDGTWMLDKERIMKKWLEYPYCMICNDGVTEATEQLPNETGYYVCYACKIAQREVSPEFWSTPK